MKLPPKKITELGTIIDKNQNPIARAWTVEVEAGIRPYHYHCHPNFEIMYVNSGNGIYSTKSNIYPLFPGDIFVFSCNEFHNISQVGDANLKITNLHFNPQFISYNSHDLNTSINFNFLFSHHPDFSNRIPCACAEKISSIYLEIIENISAKPTEYPNAVRALLQLFLINLIRHHNYLNDQQLPRHNASNIQQAMIYIDEHFSEKITLQEIASVSNLTPTYFSSNFKQTIGLSPWDYINLKRINKAIDLIFFNNDKKNILDIANECGFNNSANFNKTFKKITGLTPSEYKNSHSY